MRTGYSIKRIKDICDKGSSNVAQKDLEGHNGNYPIYGASGFIKNVDFYHQDKEYVGIVKDGSGIGRVAFYPPKSSLIGTLQYIFPKAEYDIRYVGYCLQSLDLASYRQGAAIPHIYFRDYGEREVLVAENIKEQHRIVDILDREFAKIDALKANAEKSLQAARDLFQAALKKELEPKDGWTHMRLNDLYNFIDYRGSTPTKLAEGIPLITAKNIKKGFLDYTIKDFISQEEYNHRQSRGISQRGDLLFTTEAPLGNVAIADKEVFSAGQRVITFQQYPHATIELNNRFYLYYLLSPVFQEALKEQATGATAQGIKASRLKEIKVPFVENSIQNSIVRRLDDLNDKCNILQENYQKTLTLCDDLKQALLRKAFNGEL